MIVADVERALAEVPAVRGAALSTLAENQWFDRKSILIKPRDLARHLVAFANAEGGAIVVGIQNRQVIGIKDHAARANAIRQAPLDFTAPPVRARFTEADCVRPDGETDRLLMIWIDPGEQVHETVDGGCYLRVGDESRRLSFDQRRELAYDRGQQYDGEPARGAGANDLDSRTTQEYGSAIGVDRDIEAVLRARSLMTPAGAITNGALLLFGKRPQDYFPQAYVRVLRFLSAESGTGARQTLEEGSDYRVEGPIPAVIERAQEIVARVMPMRRALGPGGKFEALPIVPQDAWLEGLVNAVVHRSYSLAGDHIRVEIYPDRVEIESPGRFPGLADTANPLTIGRYSRNPRIARVCADLHFGQELGEGIKRIFEEMRRLSLTDPVYHQTSGSVRLILTAVERLDPRIAALLPQGSQEVLDRLRQAGEPVGTGELTEALQLSRPVVLRRLRALEAAGLVRWTGKSPRDPRAAWSLFSG